MRAVVQRVSQASVRVAGATVGEIGIGLAVLLGVEDGDTEADAKYIAEKLAGLRIFADESDRMNKCVLDVGGSALMISQFTLLGDVRRGKRPSFTSAAPPAEADRLYEYCNTQLRSLGVDVATGVFRADMQVHLINDGPVTILIDSHKLF
jgi:D-aminoacyl-tRNA deacylase